MSKLLRGAKSKRSLYSRKNEKFKKKEYQLHVFTTEYIECVFLLNGLLVLNMIFVNQTGFLLHICGISQTFSVCQNKKKEKSSLFL